MELLRRKPALTAWIFVAVGLAAIGAYYAFPMGWRLYAYTAFAAVGPLAVVIGMVMNDARRRRAWLLIAAGLGVWVVGDALWSLYDTFGWKLSQISPPDIVYVAGYPVLFAGMATLVRRNRASFLSSILDAGVIAIAVAVAVWVFAIEPGLGANRHQLNVYLAALYPAFDSFLLVGVVLAVLGTRALKSRSAQLLLVGIATLIVWDTAYAHETARGVYAWGSYTDAGFLFFYLLVGAAALHPSMRELEPVERVKPTTMSNSRLVFIGLAALVLPVLLVISPLNRPTDEVFAIAGIVFVVLMFTRLVALFAVQRRELSIRTGIEDELRASRELYRLLVENAGDMIRLVDFSGTILYASPSHETGIGFRPDELVGRDVADLYHEDDRDWIANSFVMLDQGERVELGGLRLHVKDDGWRYVDGSAVQLETVDGRTLILSTTWDVTGRHVAEQARAAQLEAEQELRDEAERGRAAATAMLERMGDGYVSVDAERRFGYVNAAAEAILGKTREELRGRMIFDVFPLWKDGVIQQICERAVAEDTVLQSVETDEALGKWLDFTVYPHDEGYDAYFRDISERRVLEQQLRQAQKLEAIGQLAGGVAHDFNNLLVAITGYSSLLLAEELTEQMQHDVEEIQRAGERGAALTRQLLAFSRKQSLCPLVVDLNEEINDVEGLLRQLLGEDVELLSVRGDALWNTFVDPSQVEQILVNLAVNARDAMEEGGVLSVETLNIELDEMSAAVSGAPSAGDYVVLRVSDNGSGMSEETKQRVFEPFFTTKPPGKGTGLGLSTVYGIARQSNGAVTIASEPGVGTTVSVYFPRSASDCDARVETTRHATPTGTETVLVVEDSPPVRDLAAQMLRRQGYGVIVAGSPKHALELATNARFDVIVTDVVMPGMSGRELVRTLVERGIDLPVLFCSGYSSTIIHDDDLLGPRRGFLQKPFSLHSFASAVRELLDESTAVVA